MARSKSKAPPKKASKTEEKTLKRQKAKEDLEKLQKAVDEFDPKATVPKKFSDLPLSEATASGVSKAHYEILTDVQARAIPLALKGNDLLVAAKTGSGKTLAFLIPVLEKLHRAQWTNRDGLGALIIAPTRELAVQIFNDVLRKIGTFHDFSAGLVTGGMSVKEEASIIHMNIVVATPGRILHHLDSQFGFNVDDLQILVLDEADRILDSGFQQAVDAMLEHLPKERQTLLFSATQTKKVSDLARLSLKDPEYVSVHENAETATPTALQQFYTVTPLSEKLNTLWGFIKQALTTRMIVFLSSGKQVRYVYEAFRKLQPGMPLLHMHGKQKQAARLRVTQQFTTARHACLFATDVVARGVDFPAVDWVVQVDCPEDAETYIHRVGRTARYQSKGFAMLFLDPSEEAGMLKRLEHKKVAIKQANVAEDKKKNIKNQLQSLCFKNQDVKYLAQKAFVTYVQSIHLQKDKEIFDMSKLDLDGYAASLGLSGTPEIRLQKGQDIKKIKNAPRMHLSSGSEDEDDDEDGEKPKAKDKVRTKIDKMFERTNQDVLSSHYRKMIGGDDSDGEEDEFFSAKRTLNNDDLESINGSAADGLPKVIDLGGKPLVVDSKRREKLLKSKKKLLQFKPRGQKLVFDEDGNAHPIYELIDEKDFQAQGPVEELRRQFVEGESGKVAEADVEDRELVRQKRKEKKIKRKMLEREEREGPAGPVAQLEGGAEQEEDPLALLRSLPTPGGGRDSGDDESDVEDRRPTKKAKKEKKEKKWFQDDSDEERAQRKATKRRKVIETEEPQTLEDYEAVAAGLLDA